MGFTISLLGPSKKYGVLIEKMLKDREEARLNKDFQKADEIRKKIESLGVSIEDAPEGPLWKIL